MTGFREWCLICIFLSVPAKWLSILSKPNVKRCKCKLVVVTLNGQIRSNLILASHWPGGQEVLS